MLNTATIVGRLAVVIRLVFARGNRQRGKPQPSTDQIDALLPQTQCGRCGYPACRPYAEAIARGEADINQCPPGGDAGIHALAKLLGRKPKPLNPKHGAIQKEPIVARIDEAACIGCTRCIQVCPVDAILGAAKQMHTVIRAECTGCELCVEPCPVDCIQMLPAMPHSDCNQSSPDWIQEESHRSKADLARERYQYRMLRLTRERDERQRQQQGKKALPKRDLTSIDKKAVIQAAVARAQRRQAALAAARDMASTPRSK